MQMALRVLSLPVFIILQAAFMAVAELLVP